MLNRISQKIASYLPYDERLKFHDLSKIQPENRISNSEVLNFYSSANNIGNYTPLLGIHKMMEEVYDVWCIHDKNIDWKFINSNYKKVIIGGAGLFHESFSHFWSGFNAYCKLPSIVWGVGGIFPKNKELQGNVDKQILLEAMMKCDLVNLRDELTADYVEKSNISITPCPTIAFLEDLRRRGKDLRQVLYSSHETLLSSEEKDFVRGYLQPIPYIFTDNVQYQFKGLNRILEKYLRSKAVVTTRLHGAIIAYGLGIPYLAISFDHKLDEFHRLYGNGILFKNARELDHVDLSQVLKEMKDQEPDIRSVLGFGQLVKESWRYN